MLQRVGAALSRLIKPISLSDSSAARLDSERKQEQGFQRAEPPALPAEAPAEKPAEELPEKLAEGPKETGLRPGLTTAFLNLLSRLEERRRAIKLWPSARNYMGSASRKKSSIRKGIVLDHKVE